MFKSFLKFRFVFILIIGIFTILALIKVPLIKVNADVSQYFPQGDKDLSFYQEMRSEFKRDDHLILVGIQNKNSEINDSLFIKVNNIVSKIRTIPKIEKVTWLADISYPVKSLFGFISVPYVKFNDKSDISYSRKRIIQDFEITQNFINKTGEVFFVWVEFDNNLEDYQVEDILKKIKVEANIFSGFDSFMWGREFIDLSFKQILINEIKTLGIWMFVFLCLALILIFRNPFAIIFPITLVIIVIILFLGGMVYLDRPLGTMSILFPTIILIVGVSDVIHMLIKYNIERNKGLSEYESSILTMKEIGWTTFITSFTTAIGFFVLFLSPMKAMQNLGIESGIVILLTYILTIILLPLFILNSNNQRLFLLNRTFNSLFKKLLNIILKFKRYPKIVIRVAGVLFTFSIVGLFFINTNSQQYSIPKDSQLKESYDFFEKNFGGSRGFEIILSSKKGHLLNEKNLLLIVDSIHSYLSNSTDLDFVKSPILFYRAIHRSYYPVTYKQHEFPPDQKTILRYENQFSSLENVNFLWNKEKTIFKISARINDPGRDEIKILNQEILDNVNSIINKAPINARLSGIDFIIDNSHERSINNLLLGLLLAIVIVGITIGLFFKSKVLMLLALLLNIIPILISAGIMGFTGLELRGETALVFTVGFVIAVDDTIHFLSKIKWERRKGKTIEEAVQATLLECGKAIVATSIILFGGFAVLMISESLEIYTLGLLSGIIIFITLLVDLFLAPVIILKYFTKYL